MIIKADNRGRLALGKARGGTISVEPHTEWNVEYQEGSITIKPHPEPEPSKLEWKSHLELSPDMIGQLILLTNVSHRKPEHQDGLPKVRLANQTPCIVGELEAYSTLQGAEWVKLKGYSNLISLAAEGNYGTEYGTTHRIWTRN